MPKMNFKTKNLSAVITFAEKTSKLFVVKKGTIFFINRIKLEKILSLLCLLGEFNEKFMEVESTNITQWLKEKKLFNLELLYEIAEITTTYIR